MPPSPPWHPRESLLLGAFAVLFLAVGFGSASQKSATWDEPLHLTSGHAILAAGDYRFDPEHPPLARMWAALPLVAFGKPAPDAAAIDPLPAASWLAGGQWEASHRHLYASPDGHDADRRINAGRGMVLLLGLALGVLLHRWARKLYGPLPAAVALALCAVEPNLLAHAGLVTTDLPVTVAFFATAYFLWRTATQPSARHLAFLALACALANVTKFSALLLLPLVGATLAASAWRGLLPWRTAVTACFVTLATTWAAIWAAYAFRYAPSSSPDWLFSPATLPVQSLAGGPLEALVGWCDSHRLLPNAYSNGFLLGQAKAVQRSAYLLGEVSTEGWAGYFPLALAVKTPAATLLLYAAGLGVALKRLLSPGPRHELFVLAPLAVYAAAAINSNLNIGFRHILPLVPLLLLLAAAAAHAVLESGERAARSFVAALVTASGLEVAWVAPDLLAFFNRVAGGPEAGHLYLVDSNLDWGQDLKGLSVWMRHNGVEHINLAYFGTADPTAYDIDSTSLPGAPFFASAAQEPRLPGFVAVSETVLTGVYWGEGLRKLYAPLAEREPVVIIGHSIRVYRVEEPWW